jgi:hypothetical protein
VQLISMEPCRDDLRVIVITRGGWVCVIFFACVCVGASDMTTASDDPSSSALCVMCVGRFPRGVPGGGRYAPPGYAQRSGQCPKNFFLGGFFYF